MQFYQPSLITPSPSKSSFHSQITDRLKPKGSSSKLIRRRSRASKKTPTTFLNASTSNFRALVQQFTGKRGDPINLNFAYGSERNIQSGTATPIESASGNDYYCQQSLQKQENAAHQQHQYINQEQQHAVTSLFEGDASFSSCSGGAHADQMVDGFDLDDIYISLQALNEDVFYSNMMKMPMIP
ncbi:hypothetical protein PTKIN_Ptkin10aG0201900 [Pterospermum kingtungense]